MCLSERVVYVMLGYECGATGQLVEQGGRKDEEGGDGWKSRWQSVATSRGLEGIRSVEFTSECK